MQRLTTRLITQEIEQNSIERYELRMVLRPTTLNFRDQFRNELQNQLNTNSHGRLISLNRIENEDTIDGLDIIEIHNQTSSERRREFIQSIINYENINDNSPFLISNSSTQVRTYLNDLLVRSASLFPINEDDLYRVGNIFLYTIANIDIEGLNLRDIIQHLRAHMVMYNTDQIVNILQNHISIYNDYLESLRLATEEQLEERTQEFNQQVDERIALNRRRVMYSGMGLVGSMALTSMGLPPMGGVIELVFVVNLSNSFNSSEKLFKIYLYKYKIL